MLKKKIVNEIRKNGYAVVENFFSKKDLNVIKSTLFDTLNYIKKNNKYKNDLQKKYYEIKYFNEILKSHFYDISPHNINILQMLHSKKIVSIVKELFQIKTVFSGRPAIHVHDDSNRHLLEPHQETNQYAKDFLLLWSPLWDTNENTGGLTVYKNSHKFGYFKHSLKTKKKVWTPDYTHVRPGIYKKFKKMNLKIKAGSAVLILSSLIHCGYPNKKKGSVRIVITERYNPLKAMPYLQNQNAPMKIPYEENYNIIRD